MKRITKFTNPKVVAVTGGIGSGQSTICEHLQALGCKIIDVDKKAKRIIAKDYVTINIFINSSTPRRKIISCGFHYLVRSACWKISRIDYSKCTTTRKKPIGFVLFA